MKNQKFLLITLVTSVLLISSMISGTAINMGTTGVQSLDVQKEVYNGADWVESIEAEMDEIVTFRITVTYNNITDPSHTHYARNIVITDTLPICLDYVPGTSDPFEPDVDGKELTWDLGTQILYHGDSYVIIFNATVVDDGENINTASAVADEVCTGQKLSGSDTATVRVATAVPDIDVEKYVWDGCFWVEETSEYPDEIVSFKIVVENTGETDLYDIWVNDTLSDSLEYVIDSASPFEPDIDGNDLTWYFNTMEPDEIIEITFNATVIGLPCNTDTNWAYVEGTGMCCIVVTDQDSAKVHINGMCMEKEVWDDDHGAWMESAEVSVDEIVHFRINIDYYGPKKLYNIKVKDVLPTCFEYANNAVPEEPETNGNILWWNLSSEYDLYDGEDLTIQFDAVVKGGLCDECINWAYVTANECSGRIFEWEDPATVYVKCDFTADAGGPYYGGIGEDVEITGTASDGMVPYLFEWDLDGDGEYDDATGASILYNWSEAGTYEIKLRVTDDDDNTAEDKTAVIIAKGDNNPPDKPSTPTGPSRGSIGRTYKYSSSAVDPDGDSVYLLFEWDDGTNSGWLGPYDSGETVEANHKWTISGSFTVKVKARDHPDLEESVWSDSLSISMPKAKSFSHEWILEILHRIFEIFPMLEFLLK